MFCLCWVLPGKLKLTVKLSRYEEHWLRSCQYFFCTHNPTKSCRIAYISSCQHPQGLYSFYVSSYDYVILFSYIMIIVYVGSNM